MSVSVSIFQNIILFFWYTDQRVLTYVCWLVTTAEELMTTTRGEKNLVRRPSLSWLMLLKIFEHSTEMASACMPNKSSLQPIKVPLLKFWKPLQRETQPNLE